MRPLLLLIFFFFNDTATTEIYTLSLHDALPILFEIVGVVGHVNQWGLDSDFNEQDRKSTRLNSSHVSISYAVFCLKKKNYTLREGVNIARAEKAKTLVLFQHEQ